MSNTNICNICGANYEYIGGRWKCPACGAYKAEELSNEEVTLLYNAAQKLRVQDFIGAEELFYDIIQKYPRQHEAYWGCVCARYGIKHEIDFDGKAIPTCCNPTIESFGDDEHFKKAVELAPIHIAEWYKEQAAYIDRVRSEWLKKAQAEAPYEIFISYKDSDLENGVERTQDSYNALELYNHLARQGYNVFYSRESLRDKIGEKYEPYIFNALRTSKVMIVYGTSAKYITSTWLKNEWHRYLKKMEAGEKREGSLLVVCDGFSPGELPSVLSSKQCLDGASKTLYVDIDNYLRSLYASKVPEEKAPAPKKQIVISPLHEHAYTDEIVPASCVARGYTVHRCACGYEFKDSYTRLADHKYANKSTQEPTCTAPGYEVEVCTICGDKNLKNIPAKGHAFDKWIEQIPPTCTAEGKRIRRCSECGYVEEETLAAKVHQWSTPEQRVDEYGNKKYVSFCKHCGEEKIIKEAKNTPEHNALEITEDDSSPKKRSKKLPIIISIISVIALFFIASAALLWSILADITTTNEKETVNVSFVVDGETIISFTLNKGKDLNLGSVPYIPQKPGYSATWDTTDFSNITSDLTVNALYTANVYEITYVLDGGTNNPSNPTSYTIDSSNLTLLAPTRSDYVFMGWYSDPDFITKVATIDASSLTNITLYAKWEKAAYSITYNLNGGTNNPSNPASYTVNSGNVTLRDPMRTGYSFKGWYSDSSFTTKVTSISSGSTGNKTFYAKWEKATYSITYNLYGGTNNPSNPASYTMDSSNFTLLDPTRSDYVFKGWYSDSGFTTKVTTINVSSLTNITLYAKWEKATCTITYNLNGGTNNPSNPTGCTENSNNITLLAPTRSGYVFMGWYSDSGFTTKVTTIDASNLTNITLYAKWEEILVTYTISNGEATITGCKSGTEAVVIPSEIDGVPVTAISEKAFYQKTIKTVTIPNSVKTFGKSAFIVCRSLTSVTIGNGVETIGDYAFQSCTSLTDVTIPDSVKTIGDAAFNCCDSLTDVTIGNGVQTIGDAAFCWCYSLTGVTIPDSVETIGDSAFAGCKLLTSVTIPDSVKTIDDAAFYYCYSLTSVTIGNGVTSIGCWAFCDCSSLTEIVFKDPSGWYYSPNSNGTGGTDIPEASLSDPSTAVSTVKNRIEKYLFKK